MRIADRDSTGLRNTARDVTAPRDRACVHSSVIRSVRSIARAVVVGSSRGARRAPSARRPIREISNHSFTSVARGLPRPSARSSRVRIDRLPLTRRSLAIARRLAHLSLAASPSRECSPRWASVVARARCGHRRSHASVARARTRSAASASRSSSSRAFVRSSRVDVRRLSRSIGGGAVRRRRRVTSVILCDTVVFRILYVSCVRV